ncbi:MAG: hypothetical protein ABH864_00615 [archaeon]
MGTDNFRVSNLFFEPTGVVKDVNIMGVFVGFVRMGGDVMDRKVYLHTADEVSRLLQSGGVPACEIGRAIDIYNQMGSSLEGEGFERYNIVTG